MIDPRLGEQLAQGDVLIACLGPVPVVDVQQWASVGAALILDKPLVVLLPEGDAPPPRLAGLPLVSFVWYPPGSDPLAAPGLAAALSAFSGAEPSPPDGPTTRRPRKPPGGA